MQAHHFRSMSQTQYFVIFGNLRTGTTEKWRRAMKSSSASGTCNSFNGGRGVVVGIFLAGTVAAASAQTYEGTLYVAGMGGHIAKVQVKIDPSRAEPITVVDLDRIVLNSDAAVAKKAYPLHDVRIDHAKNMMYWSAYVADGDGVRAGKIDLLSGKIVSDVKLPKDAKLTTPPMYCGSGQTRDKYLPVVMGYQGSIDVVDKETMKLERRVRLDHPKIPKNYLWAHGVSAPNGKEFALWVSLSDKAGTFPRGSETRQHVYILDTAALLTGELKVLREMTMRSDPKASAFFRGYYTSDGKQLLISGRDRQWIVDPQAMKLLGESANPAGVENHDIQPLPGNRYALLTQRVGIAVPQAKEAKIMDGQIELYDLTKRTRVGKAVSVCNECHKSANIAPTSILCGIDSVWK
jgi:hypothetical protein